MISDFQSFWVINKLPPLIKSINLINGNGYSSVLALSFLRRMRSMNITDEASIAKPSLSQRPSLKYSNGVPSTQSDYPSSVVTSTHEDYATVARDLINRQSTTSKNPKKNVTPSTSTKYFGFTNEGMQKSQEFSDIAGPSTKF